MANEEVNAPETGGETNEPTLSEPVSSILTRAREAKGLTIDDIDDVTHISPGWVSVMEKGDWNQYPSMVYARGHVKVYAEHLDLDVASILARFHQDWARTVAPDPGESPSAPPGNPMWSRSKGDSRAYWLAGGIVAVLIIGGLAVRHERQHAKRFSPAPVAVPSPAPSSPPAPTSSTGSLSPNPATESSPPSPPSIATSSPQQKSAPEAPAKTPAPTPLPSTGSAPVAPPSSIAPATRLTLRMVGLKSVWVVISVDDGTVRHFRLNPGDERTLVGKNFMTFSTQSGDGLALFLNGKRLGLAGPNSQPVIHRRLNRQSLRRMKTAQSPSLAPRKSLSASSGTAKRGAPAGSAHKGVGSPAPGTHPPSPVKTVPLVPSPSSGGNPGSPGSSSPLFPPSSGGQN
ncbi:MAG: helix-turn-helix domain-containing protein [Leptospirillia bacterium]